LTYRVEHLLFTFHTAVNMCFKTSLSASNARDDMFVLVVADNTLRKLHHVRVVRGRKEQTL
jgi:hypothetical protein